MFKIKQCSNVVGKSARGRSAVLSKEGAVIFGALGLGTTTDQLRCVIAGKVQGKKFSKYKNIIFKQKTYKVVLEQLINICVASATEEIRFLR